MPYITKGRVPPQGEDDESDFDPYEGTTKPDYDRPSNLLNLNHRNHPASSGKGLGGGGSRRRSYRKSRKVRKSKVRVRLSKYRKHRHYRRSRRH
jgi:hypothetical protein